MTRDEILALKPGRELDAMVAEKVMGLEPRRVEKDGYAYAGRFDFLPIGDYYTDPEDSSPYIKRVPDYSTDIAAAWEVVEVLRNNHFAVRIETNRFDNMRLVKVWSNDTHPMGGFALRGESGDARHPEEVAEHVCKAAVIAVTQV